MHRLHFENFIRFCFRQKNVNTYILMDQLICFVFASAEEELKSSSKHLRRALRTWCESALLCSPQGLLETTSQEHINFQHVCLVAFSIVDVLFRKNALKYYI